MSEEGYWEGPWGVLVPNSVTECVAMDGENSCYPDGSETELGVEEEDEPTEQEYKDKYCHQRADGKWYYGSGVEGSSK